MSATGPASPRLLPEDQATIDGVLQLIYSQDHRMMGWLAPRMFQALTLEQLRAGPIGRDLERIALIGRGAIRESSPAVRETVDSILQTLFWPAGADDYYIPRSFWSSETGQLLMRAKSKSFAPAELMSVGSAATSLGVTRVTIFRWMDDRTLGFVQNTAGRTLVVRRDVENLSRLAGSLEGS